MIKSDITAQISNFAEEGKNILGFGNELNKIVFMCKSME